MQNLPYEWQNYPMNGNYEWQNRAMNGKIALGAAFHRTIHGKVSGRIALNAICRLGE
jgi:hypothetical protein